MTTATETTVTTQVYRVYIKATPQAIWDAITKPEWTQRYGYQAIAEYDLQPGGRYRGLAPEHMQAMGMPEVVVDGEVLEAEPPRKLVQTWRFLWDEQIAAEGPDTCHVRHRGGRRRRDEADRHARARERADDRRTAGGRRADTRGRRRLELGPQRPQDAARDRRGARGLTGVTGGGPARAGPPPPDRTPWRARAAGRVRGRVGERRCSLELLTRLVEPATARLSSTIGDRPGRRARRRVRRCVPSPSLRGSAPVRAKRRSRPGARTVRARSQDPTRTGRVTTISHFCCAVKVRSLRCLLNVISSS